MQKVTVEKIDKPYDIIIGSDILDRAGEMILPFICGKIAVISDDSVAALYAERLSSSFSRAGIESKIFTFSHGEKNKNAKTVFMLLEQMANCGFTRNDCVVALGGGVTGDMAGLCAALYMRGIDCIQLPTTLLADVDSSVGGKTAVNLDAGKNLAGIFHQPRLVLCDTLLLTTLTESVYREGLAEVIKYGIIKDPSILNDSFAISDIESVIGKCVTIKSGLVESDELDRGARQMLNFGHSVGHAIEKCSSYTLSHGYCVATGMAVAARIAEKLSICDSSVSSNIVKVLSDNGLPIQTSFSADELAHEMITDKKRHGDFIRLVLPEKIGKCVYYDAKTDSLSDLMNDSLR